MKLSLISLGCEKNRVDSELFLGVAMQYGIEITSDYTEADIIVINTCGFIESAKQESINTILDVYENYNKHVKIIAMGCLVERYLEDLKKELSEVDFYFPIRDYENISNLFAQLVCTKENYQMDYLHRCITTNNTSVYVRIAEGCDNKCAYCAIPLIRGPFRSRPFDDIIVEIKHLVQNGAKEITLIAQDTTRYGTDFKDNDPRRLSDLLREISKINEVKLIRTLYLYPDEITDDLLDEIANNPKVAKYFDIPIQHANNRMLKLMNRRGSKELIKTHIETIRSKVPGVIVRTTLIVGFPSETTEEFEELLEFIKEIKFERLGCFTFSKEEDTVSYNLKPQIGKRMAKKRYDAIMSAQQEIAINFNKSLIGQKFEAIIDGYDEESMAYIGRNYMFAPDDVDGFIYIYSPLEHNPGDIINIEIVNSDIYDLFAKEI